jgi:hypothetical protein
VAVSLVDADRVWFKASVGLTVREGPREGVCNLAIGGEGLFEVPDAADDPRFAGSAMVCATPGIRFRRPAAAPGGWAGHRHLCILDTAPAG